MDIPGQVAEQSATRPQEPQARLIEFAEQIAHGWAEQLGVGRDAVQWVAVKGGRRTPISTPGAQPLIHQLEKDAGIAFVLGSPGVMDLLFVVTRKSASCSVNISNNARPWDQSERYAVRPDYVGDLKRFLAAANRYARRSPVAPL